MWLFYAFLSAIFAALVAIFAKLGLKEIDSTLATIVRSIIMATFLVITGFVLRKFNGFTLHSFSSKDWTLIVLAGIAGALSWLFYFFAIKHGPVSSVAAIDRLSIIFIILLAGAFLGESLGWKPALGATLVAIGAILITL